MRVLCLTLTLAALLFSGCSGVYYDAMEKIGFAKREILVDRVGDARQSQEKAKEQFSDALEHFLAITKQSGGNLKSKYDELNREFTRSEERASEVRERIAAVDDVADALFKEWKKELRQYSDENLRHQSEQQLDQTKRHYNDLMKTMKTAAERMDPILGRFRDQVLFLKHNLNAQAIAGLSSTSQSLQADISRLIADMERSINEADAFIKTMKASG